MALNYEIFQDTRNNGEKMEKREPHKMTEPNLLNRRNEKKKRGRRKASGTATDSPANQPVDLRNVNIIIHLILLYMPGSKRGLPIGENELSIHHCFALQIFFPNTKKEAESLRRKTSRTTS